MTRLLSALVLLVILGGAAWFAPLEALLLMATGIASVAFIELARLGDALGARVPRLPGLVLTALVCVSAGWPTLPLAPSMVALLVGAGVVAIWNGAPDRASVSGIAVTMCGPLYVGLPLGALINVAWVHGRAAAVLVVLTVVASDSAQYYTGRLFGKRPLAPAISPNKTIEGALGGFVGGAIAMAWLGGLWLPSMPLGLRLGLAVLLVTVGIIGDLLESALKRAAQVKDSSHLIPGHGGVLDRIDALLLVIPVYAVALHAARMM